MVVLDVFSFTVVAFQIRQPSLNLFLLLIGELSVVEVFQERIPIHALTRQEVVKIPGVVLQREAQEICPICVVRFVIVGHGGEVAHMGLPVSFEEALENHFCRSVGRPLTSSFYLPFLVLVVSGICHSTWTTINRHHCRMSSCLSGASRWCFFDQGPGCG